MYMSLFECRCKNGENCRLWAHIGGGSADPPYVSVALHKPPWSFPTPPQALSTLGSQVCFFSMAQDESTWIRWPICHQTDINTHGPTTSYPDMIKRRGPTPNGEAPHVIGGRPTTPLLPPTLCMLPCKEIQLLVNLHPWLYGCLIQGLMIEVTRIDDTAHGVASTLPLKL
jgi:hypothetical protein